MDTAAILNRLAEAGISLGIDASGQGLTVESPAPLSPEQRRWLRANKPAILAHLRQDTAAVSPPPPLTDADRADIAEAIAERAAIMEFDGGLPRPDAEAAAAARMRAYHVHIAMPDGPPRWAVMLAPGCDLPEATADARRLFGPERVLSVQLALVPARSEP
jgi:hypothetical protein